jgi:hypothetical protein
MIFLLTYDPSDGHNNDVMEIPEKDEGDDEGD